MFYEDSKTPSAAELEKLGYMTKPVTAINGEVVVGLFEFPAQLLSAFKAKDDSSGYSGVGLMRAEAFSNGTKIGKTIQDIIGFYCAKSDVVAQTYIDASAKSPYKSREMLIVG